MLPFHIILTVCALGLCVAIGYVIKKVVVDYPNKEGM